MTNAFFSIKSFDPAVLQVSDFGDGSHKPIIANDDNQLLEQIDEKSSDIDFRISSLFSLHGDGEVGAILSKFSIFTLDF